MKFLFRVLVAVILMTFATNSKSLAVDYVSPGDFPSLEGLQPITAQEWASVAGYVGNDVYGNTRAGVVVSAADGKLKLTYGDSYYTSGSKCSYYKGNGFCAFVEDQNTVVLILAKSDISRVLFKDSYGDAHELYKRTKIGVSVVAKAMGSNSYATVLGDQKNVMYAKNGTIWASNGDISGAPVPSSFSFYQEGEDFYMVPSAMETLHEVPESYFAFFTEKGVVSYVTMESNGVSFTFYCQVSNDEFAKLLGDRHYAVLSNGDELFVEDGQVKLILSQVEVDMSSVLFIHDSDAYRVEYYGNTIELYRAPNGTLQVVSYDPKEDGIVRWDDITDEAALIKLMGDRQYVGNVHFYQPLTVKFGHICFDFTDYVNFLFAHSNVSRDGDNYVVTAYAGTYTFVVKDEKVAYVRYEDQDIVEYYLTEDCLVEADEADLVALMGDKVFVNSKTGKALSVGVVDGHVTMGGAMPIIQKLKLYRMEDDYFFYNPLGGCLEFIVRDGQVLRVVIAEGNGEYSEYAVLSVPAEWADLVAAIGDQRFVDTRNDGSYLHVDGESVVYVGAYDNESLNSDYELSKEGNNFVARYYDAKYEFVFADGKVQKVILSYYGESRPLVLPVAADEIMSLVGSNIFENQEFGEKIFISDGKLMCVYPDGTDVLNEDYILYMDGGNYVFTSGYDSYTFFIENGKISHADYASDKNSYSYYNTVVTSESMAPAAAKSVKAVKTVKNGRVVIIAGDAMYGLDGARF